MKSRPALPTRRPTRPRASPRRLLLACALLAAGCGERGPGDVGAAADGPPRYGGTLVIASPGDLDAANTLVSGEVYTQELLRFALFLPLLRHDAALEYEPALARSWEMSGDTAIVFRLRDDVVWHDGVRTTAFDVAFTFERARDPATAFPNSSYFERWTGVEVLDSFTVRFRLDPHPDPLEGWVFTPIMPRHRLESVPADRLRQAEFNKNPVGNGPFRFVAYQANDRWIFEANPDFPAELGGRPYLDRVVWRVIPENSAQVTELLTGRADMILSPRATELHNLDDEPSVRAVIKPSRKFQFIAWNGKRPPFDDHRVRRALALAIDRVEILEALRAGYGRLAVGPIVPNHWAFDSTVAVLPYDTAAARALLAEAGFRDRNGDGTLEDAAGRDFEFYVTIPAANEYSRTIAEKVQADLARIGVRAVPRPTDFVAMIDDITSAERRFDAVFLTWEPDFRLRDLRDLFHSAMAGGPYQIATYRNAELDRLLDEAPALGDRNAARPLWRRVQEILRDEQPWTFTLYVPDLYAMRERIKGAEMDIRGAFVNLPRWWIAGGDGAAAAAAAVEGGQ